MDVTVDVPGTKIAAQDIRPGDGVRDIFGEKHTITRVVRFSKTVRTYRDDGLRESWDNEQAITVIR